MCKLIAVIENNAMLVLQWGRLPHTLPEGTISQPSSYPENHPPTRKTLHRQYTLGHSPWKMFQEPFG